MHYQLSENEYNRLCAIRGQLGFVCDLLEAAAANAMKINSSDCSDFINAQHQALDEVLTIAGERSEELYQAERDNGTMRPVNWAHAFRIASGDDRYTPKDSDVEITKKLMLTAHIDPEMQQVLDAWTKAITRTSKKPRCPAPAPTSQSAKPRKRERLTAAGVA